MLAAGRVDLLKRKFDQAGHLARWLLPAYKHQAYLLKTGHLRQELTHLLIVFLKKDRAQFKHKQEKLQSIKNNYLAFSALITSLVISIRGLTKAASCTTRSSFFCSTIVFNT